MRQMRNPISGLPTWVGDHQMADALREGYTELDAKPPQGKPTFEDLVKEDWREAFTAANLGTVEAIAAATVEQLDAVDVKGLGKKKAADLIAAAKAALA